IVSKMWDEYELARSEATQLAIPIADLGAAQRRLSELKNKLKNMGPINVAAIEEYKEVAERYEFMKTQIDDVERAKAELTKMITQLSAQMSNLFMEKFTAINANFSEIFVELFGGGKGELSLTDPSDPLETGIDIFVQPPGKIIKNLSALSGGEQAFVAICIYFAILKVSPAPFVLIDEIEAALDDVNVTRFAGYLRKMTEKTQFICITHRRGTMEEADVLYGVTMEEEGVSKLLRLNVSELEEKLKLTNLK
ncbi:MAG: chromosome segregation protein SMC, partial [Angelakisella sp.]